MREETENEIDMREEERQKRIVKEAIKEWLDDQFAAFGRWSVYGILSAALVGCVYLALYAQIKH